MKAGEPEARSALVASPVSFSFSFAFSFDFEVRKNRCFVGLLLSGIPLLVGENA